MIVLNCSDQDIANIMEGLSNMPLHKSFETFINVRNQLVQQRQPQGPQQGQQATPAAPQGGGTADTGSPPNGRDVSQ